MASHFLLRYQEQFIDPVSRDGDVQETTVTKIRGETVDRGSMPYSAFALQGQRVLFIR